MITQESLKNLSIIQLGRQRKESTQHHIISIVIIVPENAGGRGSEDKNRGTIYDGSLMGQPDALPLLKA